MIVCFCLGLKRRVKLSPVVHLSSLQQAKSVSDDRVEDLVTEGELRLETLENSHQRLFIFMLHIHTVQ